MQWCRTLLVQKRCPGTLRCSAPNQYVAVIVAALEMAGEVRRAGASEQLLMGVLGRYRRTAGQIDGRWLEDL